MANQFGRDLSKALTILGKGAAEAEDKKEQARLFAENFKRQQAVAEADFAEKILLNPEKYTKETIENAKAVKLSYLTSEFQKLQPQGLTPQVKPQPEISPEMQMLDILGGKAQERYGEAIGLYPGMQQGGLSELEQADLMNKKLRALLLQKQIAKADKDEQGAVNEGLKLILRDRLTGLNDFLRQGALRKDTPLSDLEDSRKERDVVEKFLIRLDKGEDITKELQEFQQKIDIRNQHRIKKMQIEGQVQGILQQGADLTSEQMQDIEQRSREQSPGGLAGAAQGIQAPGIAPERMAEMGTFINQQLAKANKAGIDKAQVAQTLDQQLRQRYGIGLAEYNQLRKQNAGSVR